MVFDEIGERLTPTHAVKKRTRYRYYVSTSLVTGIGSKRSGSRRIPSGNLEDLVINRIRKFLADPGEILDAVDSESHSGSEQAQLIERGRKIAEEFGRQAPNELKALLIALHCRVEIRSNRIDIMVSVHPRACGERGHFYVVHRKRGCRRADFARRPSCALRTFMPSVRGHWTVWQPIKTPLLSLVRARTRYAPFPSHVGVRTSLGELG